MTDSLIALLERITCANDLGDAQEWAIQALEIMEDVSNRKDEAAQALKSSSARCEIWVDAEAEIYDKVITRLMAHCSLSQDIRDIGTVQTVWIMGIQAAYDVLLPYLRQPEPVMKSPVVKESFTPQQPDELYWKAAFDQLRKEHDALLKRVSGRGD